MRKVVFAFNFTADGYASHTDGIADEELHRHFTGLLRKSEVILYGRTTFELMVPYWPEVARSQSEKESSNEFALVFDSLEKVVFSRTLKKIEDRHSRLAKLDLIAEVQSLKQKPGKDICVGSLSIASQLSERGLIDEYEFLVHPVVAGKGPRLFENVQLTKKFLLDFVGSKVFQSGVVVLQYKRRHG